ncbi:MAG: porin [Cellvibrionaceae bacterium]|nr:porin [Cellvibrionaceae bacterium]|tara:strand:- start:46668 stop:47957 length:1290 start_codon:yes stop_codon:yes gene_type:complete
MNYKNTQSPLALAVGATLMLSALPSLADADMQKRVEMLERELMALKTQLQEKEEIQLKKGVELKKGTRFQYGGYVKLDGMWSKNSDQRRANNVGDDFLVPSTIAVGDESNEGDAVFDSNAKFSRLWFKTRTETDAGLLTSYIETDFNGSNDERLTNQSVSGLRHAFVNWDYSESDSLLLGQTWSTFFNVGALPETLDFVGPTSGTVFVRQAQARWTHKMGDGTSFMLAAENPSVSMYDAGGGFEANDIDESSMPDLIARYNGKAGNFSYSLAAMGREISYDTGSQSDDEMGFGVSLSGKWVFENGDDLKFMVNHGNLGRYVGLNAFRDAAVEIDGDIDLIDMTGGFIAYRHHWNEKFRSTFSYAMSSADNSDDILSDVTETISNANINLMYSPTKKLTLGAEFIYAEREVESGLDGDLERLQFMGKWAF